MANLVVKSNIKVTQVATRAERKRFFLYPWQLYAKDPLWIPPLRMNQEEGLNFRKNPFYEFAEIQTFYAERNGEVVGRIAAIVNRAHIERFKEQLGFFGFYESIDDESVARALFDAATEWLMNKGMTAVRGPMMPSQNYECGLLVDGFDRSPFIMMTYNPPYYDKLFKAAGLEKSQDLYAYYGHIDMISGLDKKLRFMIDATTERFGVVIRPMNTKKFRQEVEMFLDIYNQSMAGTWGFVPLSANEIRHMAAGMKYLIHPRLAVVAEIAGKPVGASFALLDYNPRIKAINGRLFPFGFMKLLGNKKGIKSIRVLSTNVVPEYQAWGVGLVVIAGLMPLVHEWGIEDAEFSWVLESNKLSRGSLERGGAKHYKTYRIYEKDLT
jgi:hypothetical protein